MNSENMETGIGHLMELGEIKDCLIRTIINTAYSLNM